MAGVAMIANVFQVSFIVHQFPVKPTRPNNVMELVVFLVWLPSPTGLAYHRTWFQTSLLITLWTRCLLTLNILDILFWLTPFLYQSRIALTFLLFNLAFGRASPNGNFPLIFASAKFSFDVPRRRCFGFMHILLSQLCKTIRFDFPFPIFPLKHSNIYLWSGCISQNGLFLGIHAYQFCEKGH